MLRIPAAGDRTPPLLAPLKIPKPEELLADAAPKSDNRRRKKKSRHGESHAWDSSSGKTRHSRRDDRRQMYWMFAGGFTLFALIVAGVLMILHGGEKSRARTAPAPLAHSPVSADAEIQPTSDQAFLAVAEPMARKFLEATKIEDLLPLVNNPKLAEERMRRFYPDGKITSVGMSSFNTMADVTRGGHVFSVIVRTRDFEEKKLSFHENPEGFRVDWESWVGWSEMTWDDFRASKPAQPKLFRVNLSPVDYYNVAFTDDKKWMSYRLESPDGRQSVYGYAEVGSVLNSKLRQPADSKAVGMILALRFPENAASDNQVLIDRIIAEGWVLEKEETQ